MPTSTQSEFEKFANLGYEDFRRLAVDPNASESNRIGFPDSYRAGFEPAILGDIRSKLTNLEKPQSRFLDIGPGCGALALEIIAELTNLGTEIILIDSPEMLAHLPDGEKIQKIEGPFPGCTDSLSKLIGSIDSILCYSVLHYIFAEAAFWRFLDVSLSLLAPGGQFLIGDIPNISKRKRFLSSAVGVEYHRQNFPNLPMPKVQYDTVELDKIDDAVMLGLIMRARSQGFHAYLLPQASDLPLSNRREDILIIKD